MLYVSICVCVHEFFEMKARVEFHPLSRVICNDAIAVADNVMMLSVVLQLLVAIAASAHIALIMVWDTNVVVKCDRKSLECH